MKRIISIILTLFIFCIIYELVVSVFIKKYKYNYEFIKNDKAYNIEEDYSYSNKNHLYNIKISHDNITYIYLVNHNYHKEKEILKDLVVYNEGNFECIFPIFKDNVLNNIECSSNGKIYSYDYLKQLNDEKVLKMRQQLIKKGYNVRAFNDITDNTKELNSSATSLNYYTDFISNYNVIVWNYKGVFSINKNKNSINEFLNSDVYDSRYLTSNTESMVVMNVDSDEDSFDKIYVVNIKDGKQKSIDFVDTYISTNSYFNGSYGKNVYFIDSNSDTQYKIDLNKEQLSVSSKENKVKYFDGEKLINKKVSSISNSNIIFNDNVVNKKISKLYSTNDIKLSNNHYYFRTNDGNLYMCLEDDYKNPILLFNAQEFKEWKVVGDSVFGIYKDKLYAYNSRYGLKPIISYNEFNYHTKNMYAVINIE